MTRGFARPPRGSGHERGTNRVHVFENRKKVGCIRPRPMCLGLHPGNDLASHRSNPLGARAMTTRVSGPGRARERSRVSVGSGSASADRRSSGSVPALANDARPDATGGNDGVSPRGGAPSRVGSNLLDAFGRVENLGANELSVPVGLVERTNRCSGARTRCEDRGSGEGALEGHVTRGAHYGMRATASSRGNRRR